MADSKHPRKFSEEFKRQIVQLYDNGKSAAEIRTEYDNGHSTLHRWAHAIHENGSTRAADNRSRSLVIPDLFSSVPEPPHRPQIAARLRQQSNRTASDARAEFVVALSVGDFPAGICGPHSEWKGTY